MIKHTHPNIPFKSRVVYGFFRFSSFFNKNYILKIIGFPVRVLYTLFTDWILGIYIPDTVLVKGLFIVFHGQGLILHPKTQLGRYVVLRQNTTIGSSNDNGIPPIICDNVSIGANSVILGNIRIGNNVIIGAGTVVLNDVPDNAVVVGNPARIIKYTQVNK